MSLVRAVRLCCLALARSLVVASFVLLTAPLALAAPHGASSAPAAASAAPAPPRIEATADRPTPRPDATPDRPTPRPDAAPDRSTPRPEITPDRSTPRATIEGFQRAMRAGDNDKAAQYLDLGLLPKSRRAAEGPELAHDLGLLLGWSMILDPKELSDDPEGDPADGPSIDVLGTVVLDGEPVPISLARTRLPDGSQGWLFARTTVAMIPALYEAQGRQWLGDRLPEVLTRISFLDVAAWQWLGLLLSFAFACAFGYAVGSLMASLVAWLARRSNTVLDDRIVRAGRGPLKLALGLAMFAALVPLLQLNVAALHVVSGVRNGMVIVGLAWLAIQGIELAASSFEGRLPEDTLGELRSRGLRTQIGILRRIAGVLVGLVAGAAVLIQFEIVRAVGTSLLASAGIAGIVLGIAAQKTLGGVFAGIQVALAQPIRIGDAVVVENEFGTIEEMKFTYVVVRLWDERRLIVPTSRFLEQPFQNWTRMGTQIRGVVTIPVDHTTPVEAMRAELERICHGHPLWDGRACDLQVTDATDRVIVLRAVVSSSDHSKNFDLRCDVRERLVRFLQQLDGGAHLPRQRVDDTAQPTGHARRPD